MFLFIYGQQEKIMCSIVLCLLRKGRQSLLQKKEKEKKNLHVPETGCKEKEKGKKKQKAKLSKEKNKSGIVYVEVAQSLVATSCYSLFDLMFSCFS